MRRQILQNPILRTLPLGPLSELLAQGRERSFAPGQALIREGESNRFMYVLEEGEACISCGGHVVAEVGEGEIIGEFCGAGLQRPAADVIAANDVLAIAFPMEVVDEMGIEYPAFAERLRGLCRKRSY